MVRLKKEDQQAFEQTKDLLGDGTDHERGFVRSLFFGQLRLDRLMPWPEQDADEARRTDELIRRIDEFMRREVDADRIDMEERIPQHVIDGLGELGVLGMTVPREYGGGGFSHTAYCRVLEHISRHCASTAVFIGAHQSIGLKALVLNGNEAQKRRWLPDLAAGRTIAAFCLSEPEVGSDAASVQTTARLSEDGEHWILNGEKRYATNAAFAGFMTVMARTPVDEPTGGNGSADGSMKHDATSKGKAEHDGATDGSASRRSQSTRKHAVTAFIVTPDLPGFEVVSPNRSKCGIRGSWQATLRFTDMRVPRDHVLGELGRGLKVALTVLDYGRCTLSAGCVAAANAALEKSVARARERRQFNRPIGEFHLIKEKIARMAEQAFALEAMTYLTAGLVDRHDKDVMLETAAVKLYCSESAWTLADEALQIWGGEGYMREHGLERMLRDLRINRIVEGTSEVMTSFIALMGMKGVGEQLEQTLLAMRRPLTHFRDLGRFARHEWRDVVVGHGRDHTLDALRPELRSEGKQLAHLTRRFARNVNRVLATYRERIIDQQLIQRRLTWSAMELYAMAAVLARLQAMLESSPAEVDPAHSPRLRRDLTVGRSFCRSAARRISHHLDTLINEADDDRLHTAEVVLDHDPTNAAAAMDAEEI